MNSLIIQAATLNDAQTISELSAKTFIESYSEWNTKQNVDKYVSENFNIEKVESEVRDTNSHFALAKYSDSSIGYLKLRANSTLEQFKNENAIEIERIYVLKGNQNQKIGAALMQFAINLALEKGYNAIWLGVWQHNNRAIKFYENEGFVNIGSKGFMFGDDLQTDFIMLKNLNQ